MVDVATTVFQDHLLPQFSRAVQDAKSYSYDYRGVPAYYEKREPATTEEEKALEEANNRFLKFFRNTLPMLAYAYQTPDRVQGPTPIIRMTKCSRFIWMGSTTVTAGG